MVLIIFTRTGLQASQAEIDDAVSVIWHNPQLLTEHEQQHYQTRGIQCLALPKTVDVEDTKATLWALEYVEKHSQNQEIMIECA